MIFPQQTPGRDAAQGGVPLVTDARGFLEHLQDTAFRLLPRLFLAIVILLAFVAMTWAVGVVLRRVLKRTHLEQDVTDPC